MSQLTYVYCVVHGARRPALAKPPRGLLGCGKPRLLDADDGLWLVVATAPADRFGEEGLARRLEDVDWIAKQAVAHQAVVEHAMAAGAAVPMRLLTLFADDARAVKAIRARRKQLAATLERVRGCHEWGVRVVFDEAGAARAGREQLRATVVPGSGASYLGAKKRQRELIPELLSDARRGAEALYRDLAGAVTASAKRPVAGRALERRLLLDAAFLVPKKERARFERKVERAARTLKSSASCQVTLSGPWPPYHFVGGAR